ncbi:uncharacterized protein LOC112504446 [Cynara cardunculus var. scolymus]|uniref:uncharacterized protein LOC112504446 n=1 Tax=Cynara cardunculus var. scolymus TaxID=59895 RepID=UPI000D630B07|nr:uncharacterized protein LOC112504446 [Cynara cardunculus var. scolymus]
MAPFESLYGRKCRTPLCWRETSEKVLVGPEMIQITHDKIQVIRERIKDAQDRQKSYADNRRRPIEFTMGDMVMLKLSPWKGILRFGKQAYRLDLPEELFGIHEKFHVGYLQKCLGKYDETIPLAEVKIDERLRYIEEPEEILNERMANLQNKTIDLVLVKWKHHRGPNCTWENKEKMLAKYPELFEK